ncbi:probable L-cysteine desulfhydrase, chloroplastic [Anneissia japonica]|uniref:probable L-cysteine desulfhydrase, chloroplastic n=1 Tax=Anneissia japonica TaxID=1529436 RepID=UPI001425AD9B|nr:probable L-cysteine desulfhydrase, chloroplastic [Anneissia japonica]XP_033122058.1 probable L-cysteine desulfhydrase, chloroplastic [Anneissia japonica]
MEIKFPIASKDQLIDQLKEKIDCNSGIKLIILDHITGPSAILMPIEELIQVCHQKGVMVMVDGAHAPGQVKLELDKLGAHFYIGNLHKWCYSARGCAFLYVNSKVRDAVHPVVTTSFERPRLRDRFILQGTKDYTSLCASSAAVEYFKDIGGLTAVTKYNSSLLSWATDMLCKAWNTSLLPIPDSMQAPFMVLIKMPDIENVPLTPEGSTSIAASVYKQHNLHIACTRVDGRFWLRLSAHIYNYEDDFYKLRDALMDMYQSSYNLNS